MIRRSFLCGFFFWVLSLRWAAADQDEPPTPAPNDDDRNSTTSFTLAEYVSDEPQLTILRDALGLSGLNFLLNSPDLEATLLAPVNAAFAALDQAYVQSLLTPPYTAHLLNLLGLHVIPDAVLLADDLEDGAVVTALSGENLRVNVDSDTGDVSFDSPKGTGAAVVEADVIASNGVAHLLDAVLLPGFIGRGLLDLFSTTPDGVEFSILQAILEVTGLLGAIPPDAVATVLAPTDAAFLALGDDFLEFYLNPANQGQLVELILSHVILDELYPTQILSEGQRLVTALGVEVTVAVQDDQFGFSGGNVDATVVRPNLLAQTAVAHAIDAVLFLSGGGPPPVPTPSTGPPPPPGPASTLVCEDGKCTFTRVDTDGYAPTYYYNNPPYYGGDSYPPISAPYYGGSYYPVSAPFYGDGSFPPVQSPFIREPHTDDDDDTEEFTTKQGYYQDGLLAPWTDPIHQDRLSETVAITRDYRGGIFNALVEYDQYNEYSAPTKTRWALLPEGKTFEETRCELRFCSWLECFAQYDARNMLNKPGVVYLVEEDEYYNIMFTNWTTARDDSYYYNALPQEQQRGDEPKKDTPKTRQAARDRHHRVQEQHHRRRRLQYPGDCNYNDDYYGGGCDDYDYEYGELGGGFQYKRDEFPIVIDDTVPCPRCVEAKASPAVLTGPVDDSFVDVSIEGVTPDDAEIEILSIGQDRNQRCNSAVFEGTDQVRPNGKGVGNSTAMLRRTVPIGLLTPLRYTVFFSATNEAGLCRGQVQVCSPPEGFDSCDDFYYYGFDATATRYCEDGGFYYY